jgi:hypothetical protein
MKPHKKSNTRWGPKFSQAQRRRFNAAKEWPGEPNKRTMDRLLGSWELVTAGQKPRLDVAAKEAKRHV